MVDAEPFAEAPELDAEPFTEPLAPAPFTEPLPLADPPSVPIGVELPLFADEGVVDELSGFDDDPLNDAFWDLAFFDAMCVFLCLLAVFVPEEDDIADLSMLVAMPVAELVVELSVPVAVVAVELTALVALLAEGVAGVDGAVPLTVEETLPDAEPLVSPEAEPLALAAADPGFLVFVV